MANCVTAKFEFGKNIDKNYISGTDKVIISTIPMPKLMSILGWESSSTVFGSVNGVNIKARVSNMDSYFSLYVPDPEYKGSRISVTGDELTIECPNAKKIDVDETVYRASIIIGVSSERIKDIKSHEQKYAKILPIDDSHRKRFILWATENYNIYSLGRFATWRPGLLLDDVVNDVRIICKLANGESSYDAKKGG